MAKPIFVVGLPKTISMKSVSEITQDLTQRFKEYYVLVYASRQLDDPSFQCFYEKDFDEVKYEELKKIIEDKIK